MKLNEWNMEMFSLKGKKALVTGGNKGLGQGYAVALAKAGADIFISSLDESKDEITSLIEDTGRRLVLDFGDITDADYRKGMVDRCMKEFGTIDILVNNAGLNLRNTVLDQTADEWNLTMDVNLNSLFFLSQIVGRIMVEKGSGKIINIASMLSFTGGIFSPSYPASKHGVVGVTKAFANQLAKHNIQVNAIAPGYIAQGNMLEKMNDKEFVDKLMARVPANRWADVADLMGTAVFLASGASDFVNGVVIPVDGGYLSL